MEALQITAGERRVMLSLILASLVLSAMSLLLPKKTLYDNSYYEPIIEEFQRLSGIKEKERKAILARYEPLSDWRRESFLSLLQLEDGPRSLVMIHNNRNSAEETNQFRNNFRVHKKRNDEHHQSPRKTDSLSVFIQVAEREALLSLPGIGPVTADRIVDYREKNGKFEKPEDLLNVTGIGPVTLEKIRDYLYFE